MRNRLFLLFLASLTAVFGAYVTYVLNPTAGIAVLVLAAFLAVAGSWGFVRDLVDYLAGRARHDPSSPCPPYVPSAELTPEILGATPSGLAEKHRRRGRRPPYVARDVDNILRAAILSNAFVLVVGASKSGKSRACFEAIRSALPGSHVIVASPRDHDALRRVASGECPLPSKASHVIVSFDDIDDHVIENTIDYALVRDLLALWPRVRLVGTIRASDYLRLTQLEDTSEYLHDSQRTLLLAKLVDLPSTWTEAEAARAARVYKREPFDRSIGLPAHLVGGPQLALRMTLGQSQSPVGVAIAIASCDVRRAGLLRSLSRDELRDATNSYMASLNEPLPTVEAFESGLTWACQETNARVALVMSNALGFDPFDYTIALRTGARPGGIVDSVAVSTRELALRLASPTDAYGVARAAYLANARDVAKKGFCLAATSEVVSVASDANLALGVLAIEDGDYRAAIAYNDSVLQTLQSSPGNEPSDLGLQAMVNKAAAFGLSGDYSAADEASAEVLSLTKGRTDTVAEEAASKALVNRATALARLGDHPGASTIYDDIELRFGESNDPSFRLVVANARINSANLAARQGHRAAAIDSLNGVINELAGSVDRRSRDVLASALIGRAVEQNMLGQYAASIESADAAIVAVQSDTNPRSRNQVARALSVRGYAAASMGNVTDAQAAYEQIARLSASDTAPILRSTAAKAVFDRALLASRAGDNSTAIDHLNDLLSTYSDDSDTEVATVVAKAYVNRGIILAELGEVDRAIESYDDLVLRLGGAVHPDVQEQLVAGSYNKARLYSETRDRDTAVRILRELIGAFDNSPFANVRARVGWAMLYEATLIGQSAGPREEIARYDEILRTFGAIHDADSDELASTALFNKAVRLRDADAAVVAEHGTAIEALEQVVSRYGNSSALSVQIVVARALFNLGLQSSSNGDIARAAASFQELLARFGDDSDSRLRELVDAATDEMEGIQ